MRSALIVVIIAFAFGGSLFSRQVALLTYVWFSLFRPLEWIWWDLSALRLSLVSGLILLVPSLATGKFPNASHPLTIMSWLFLGLGVLAQYTTFLPLEDQKWEFIDTFARLIVVSALAVTLLTTKERLSQFVAVVAGSFAFFSAKAGVVAIIGGGVQIAVGQAGSFSDNNGYALAVNMAIPFMAAAAVTLRVDVPWMQSFVRYARQGFLLAIPLSVITVISTMSRAGLLALGVLAIVLALLQRRPLLWSAGIVVAGLLTFQFAPMPEGYMERMETIRTYDEIGEQSALSRLHFWRVAVLMAEDNPLGIGLRNYDNAYNSYDFSSGLYGEWRSVHSSHFEVLAEFGYAGFVLWVIIFAYALFVCLRIRYSAVALSGLSAEDRTFYTITSTALAASMLAFLLGGAFIASASNEITWLTFGVTAALHRVYLADARALRPVRVDAARVAPVIPRARKAIA